jgi:copper homeostasis protein
MTVEVVVYNIASALKAEAGGADRIELCDSPGDGGTTPSYGAIEVVRQNVNLDVFVMIRPRGGDFCYSSYEFHAMKRDISQCQRLSIDGLVFGILLPDGRIDKQRCNELIRKIRPLKVTCHRAFDMTRDPFEALEDCIEVGFDRILTSGHHPTAAEGIPLIRELVGRAAGRIVIMPGSGVNEDTVKDIVSETAVQEIHISAAATVDSDMVYRNERIATMGNSPDEAFTRRTVDPDRVRRIRMLAESASSGSLKNE